MTSRIRAARQGDVVRLVEIELDAGRMFFDVGMPQVAAHLPDAEELRAATSARRVWVAEADGDVAGYVSAEIVDGNAHIAQVSVAPPYAGRRLGQALIEHVEGWGRGRGCRATTLTTFRDVPWNAPYYARLGYEILPDDRLGPELRLVMAHEATMPGIDASRRCAMIRE